MDSIVPRTGNINPSDKWPMFKPRDYGRFAFIEQHRRAYFAANQSVHFDLALRTAGAPALQVGERCDQMRDFIHVSSCVAGVITKMDSVEDESAVNLSSGILAFFKEFAHLAAELVGGSQTVVGNYMKPDDVFARGGHTSRQCSLDFKYSISFAQGISRKLDFLADFQAKT